MAKLRKGINGELDMSRLARSEGSVQLGDALLGFRTTVAENLLRAAPVKYKTSVAVVLRYVCRWWIWRGRAIRQFCFSDHKRAAAIGIRALNNTVGQLTLLRHLCSYYQMRNQSQQESSGGNGDLVWVIHGCVLMLGSKTTVMQPMTTATPIKGPLSGGGAEIVEEMACHIECAKYPSMVSGILICNRTEHLCVKTKTSSNV